MVEETRSRKRLKLDTTDEVSSNHSADHGSVVATNQNVTDVAPVAPEQSVNDVAEVDAEEPINDGAVTTPEQFINNISPSNQPINNVPVVAPVPPMNNESKGPPKPPIERLPAELIGEIFQYFDFHTLVRCLRVNKRWRKCILVSKRLARVIFYPWTPNSTADDEQVTGIDGGDEPKAKEDPVSDECDGPNEKEDPVIDDCTESSEKEDPVIDDCTESNEKGDQVIDERDEPNEKEDPVVDDSYEGDLVIDELSQPNALRLEIYYYFYRYRYPRSWFPEYDPNRYTWYALDVDLYGHQRPSSIGEPEDYYETNVMDSEGWSYLRSFDIHPLLYGLQSYGQRRTNSYREYCTYKDINKRKPLWWPVPQVYKSDFWRSTYAIQPRVNNLTVIIGFARADDIEEEVERGDWSIHAGPQFPPGRAAEKNTTIIQVLYNKSSVTIGDVLDLIQNTYWKEDDMAWNLNYEVCNRVFG